MRSQRFVAIFLAWSSCTCASLQAVCVPPQAVRGTSAARALCQNTARLHSLTPPSQLVQNLKCPAGVSRARVAGARSAGGWARSASRYMSCSSGRSARRNSSAAAAAVTGREEPGADPPASDAAKIESARPETGRADAARAVCGRDTWRCPDGAARAVCGRRALGGRRPPDSGRRPAPQPARSPGTTRADCGRCEPPA
jgi:hypothetical protein